MAADLGLDLAGWREPPARELARAKPNPMINGHQDWLVGLVAAARAAKA